MEKRAAEYRDADGVAHDVVVRMNARTWRVLDVSRVGRKLVEKLSSAEDGYEQALAIAREYAQEQEAAVVEAALSREAA